MLTTDSFIFLLLGSFFYFPSFTPLKDFFFRFYINTEGVAHGY